MNIKNQKENKKQKNEKEISKVSVKISRYEIAASEAELW